MTRCSHFCSIARALCEMQAIERGEDDGTDWHGSKESLIQARADEQTIQVVLGKVYAKQQVFFLHPIALPILHRYMRDCIRQSSALLEIAEASQSTASCI